MLRYLSPGKLFLLRKMLEIALVGAVSIISILIGTIVATILLNGVEL